MSNLAEVKNVYTGYFGDYLTASEVAECDSLRMSMEYGNLPYAYNVTLVNSKVVNMFDVVSNGKWRVNIYIFDSEQEKDLFMAENANIFNIPSKS